MLVFGLAGFMWQFFKYADRNKTKCVVKTCGIRPRSHIRIKPTYGNEEGGEVTEVHIGTSFSDFQPSLH